MRCEPEPPSAALLGTLSPAHVDCYMAASLAADSSFDRTRTPALPEFQRLVPRRKDAAVAWRSALSPAIGALDHRAPRFHRWHVETQESLFAQLRRIWTDDAPRVMVDLGCHAGHTRHKNVSDALLWLHYFNHSGGAVLGVDAWEDFALDLQHRLDRVARYAPLAVEKHTLTRAIWSADGKTFNMRAIARQWVSCCTGKSCGWTGREAEGADDHMCRITRQRLGVRNVTARLPLPPSSSSQKMFDELRESGWTAEPYNVRTARLDTLWKGPPLHGRRIDFLKVDVDETWLAMGVEGLFAARGFAVMTIEVDASWGDVGAWNVTQTDQLVWLAMRHNYDVYLKVPCRLGKKDSLGRPQEPSTWLYPLGRGGGAFVPSRYTALLRPTVYIQDLLIADARMPELKRLPALASEDCPRAHRALRLQSFPRKT